MTYLIPKILLSFGLPVAITIFWQRRFYTQWNILLFALIAFAVNHLVRIPLDLVFPELVEHLPYEGNPTPPSPHPIAFYLITQRGIWVYLVLQGALFGILRECPRWILFRCVATDARSWADGVFFGISYSCVASILHVVSLTYDIAANQISLTNSLDETIIALNNEFDWGMTIGLIWAQGVFAIIFDVSTSLAVMFSAHRLDVRFLLLAVLLYMVLKITPYAVLFSFPHEQPRLWDFTLPFWTAIPLMEFMVILPAFGLIFYLHKVWIGAVSAEGSERALRGSEERSSSYS